MEKRVLRITHQLGGVKPTKRNGKDGSELYGRIETVYEFYNAHQFIEKFPPTKPSESLMKAISDAFETYGTVVYNTGNGNQSFYFQENK